MIGLFYVAIGGSLGAVLRYLLVNAAARWAGDSFPYGTLLVNAIGCALMGVALALFSGPHAVAIREEHRLAIQVGVLGGFTTYSAYALDTLELARTGSPRLAILNIILTNALALIAVITAYRITARFMGG